ncbi:hypothetical protein V5O48_012351 [Marasmius crinis-equi]|uniref:Uncharacterized protein n=1 Tax=Marasmius crinis-equi TaxID=585013 RepID=A0ABR3F3B3_9AGAR
MDPRRRQKRYGFAAVVLLLFMCDSRLQGRLERDTTELSVELKSARGGAEWSELSWSKIEPTKELTWVGCYTGGFECCRLEVPLNYNEPEGKSAAIALIRLRANLSTDNPEYRGPVLFNPGGPGGSGVDLIKATGHEMSTILGPQFDILGFDPRGVARSTPRISFFKSRVERRLWSRYNIRELNHSADTVASVHAQSKITGDLAAQRDEDVLAHINTDQTARDMLKITEAHGREKLQYWGFSYGSVLGSTFAAMFPDKVERLVIDGVVDASDDYYTTKWTTSLRDTDKALQWFFKDCLEAGPTACSFYEPSIETMNAKLNNLYASIIQSPVPVRTNLSYGLVDYARLRFTVFKSLYDPFEKWSALATGLQDLIGGNGTVLYSIMDEARFECSCDPSDHSFESLRDAQTAIACNDGDDVPPDLESAHEHYANVLKVSEWGSLWAGMRLACGGWPRIPKTQFRGPIAGNTSFPLLVIGNSADPVTPLAAAHKISEGFPGSVVLTQDSAGHCSSAAPSVCTARVVREYFVNGTLPEAETLCPIDGSPFHSPGERSLVELGRDGVQHTLGSQEDPGSLGLAQAMRDLATVSRRGNRVLPLHV